MVLKFVPESLGQTVQILATGMIGIFTVTGIIILVVLKKECPCDSHTGNL